MRLALGETESRGRKEVYVRGCRACSVIEAEKTTKSSKSINATKARVRSEAYSILSDLVIPGKKVCQLCLVLDVPWTTRTYFFKIFLKPE